ncbi:tetratricopeptide repeat protein [Rhizobium sp. CB3060]|uniref:tetratricopeptide repeat protein n=1 Tax=Rhizobium sp. CB3060 TaxID=3138255 RepID=UPI0040542A29
MAEKRNWIGLVRDLPKNQSKSAVSLVCPKAADAGSAAGQVNVGDMYVCGKGTPLDYSQAMLWYRKAADKGNAVAQDHIGNMYARGWGVAQDKAEALAWFRKAADQGLVEARTVIMRCRDQTISYRELASVFPSVAGDSAVPFRGSR